MEEDAVEHSDDGETPANAVDGIVRGIEELVHDVAEEQEVDGDPDPVDVGSRSEVGLTRSRLGPRLGEPRWWTRVGTCDGSGRLLTSLLPHVSWPEKEPLGRAFRVSEQVLRAVYECS